MLSALAISDAPTPSAFSLRNWSASIEATRPLYTRLRFGDALELALAAKVSFELRKDAEHTEEALARGRRRRSIRSEYNKSGIRGNQRCATWVTEWKGN
jgi:hypothetical protein